MIEISAIRAALHEFVVVSRANRTARAERARLESELRAYSSTYERAELDAILSRYQESETHRVWENLSVPAAAWGRAV